MARVNNNADEYAAQRVGIFFPAHNNTNADGNLTGQCVTLIKWFMAEMSSVPSPFAARGDARYVGKNLVAQGHAIEVPYAQRQRGDIITNEYGTYGHIYVQLSGGRVFEENANAGGAARRVLSDGTVVYASRIGSENESFRRDVHVYRLKTYSEGGNMSVDKLSKEEVIELHRAFFIGDPGPGYGYEDVGTPLSALINKWKNSGYRKNVVDRYWAFDQNQQTINSLNNQLTQLNLSIQKLTSDDASDKARIEELQAIANNTKQTIDTLTKKNNELAAEAEKYKDDIASSQKAGNAFLLWIGEQLKKITGGK